MTTPRVRNAARDLLLARARLVAFEKAWIGSWFPSKDHERRELGQRVAYAELEYTEATLADPEPDPNDVAGVMTAYAAEKIARIPGLLKPRMSKRALATALEVDRSTLDDWIARGWMTWPVVKSRQ